MKELPAIEVETRIKGKRITKKFDETLNTSVFANNIVDLLEKSDDKKIFAKIVPKKTTR